MENLKMDQNETYLYFLGERTIYFRNRWKVSIIKSSFKGGICILFKKKKKNYGYLVIPVLEPHFCTIMFVPISCSDLVMFTFTVYILPLSPSIWSILNLNLEYIQGCIGHVLWSHEFTICETNKLFWVFGRKGFSEAVGALIQYYYNILSIKLLFV